MKKWKIGLIGTGWWSEKHLKAWAKIPNAEVVALCNRSRPKMEEKANIFGISENNLFTTIEEMLDKVNIDVIDIVTGPESHLDYVQKAAKAGKHILCQKPFAPTLAEAETMVQTAKDYDVRLMVTENWRWLMPFRIIKETIDAGKLGKIRTVRYSHTDWYTPRMSPETVLPQPFFRDMPHLLFYEMGAHWFDTWRSLFGTPERLYAEISSISPYIKGEDSGIVTMGYPDWYGYMDMSWATRRNLESPPKTPVWPENLERLVIDGDEATLKLQFDGSINLVTKDGSHTSVIAEKTWLDHEYSHELLAGHFIDCMETGKPFFTSGEDNLTTMKMIFAVYDSAKTHQAVFL